MTSKMVVHGIPGSPYVRAALLTLEEKGADYEFAAMAPGALKQHPHLSRHPFEGARGWAAICRSALDSHDGQ